MTSPSLAGQRLSAAMTTDVAARLAGHLRRADGQEDLCFAIWRASTGQTRSTAIVTEPIWPGGGDRLTHGNASFSSGYFLRAAAAAAAAGGGLALIHSHPGARGWQQLSADDHAAEAGHAAQAQVLTGQPLVGLTYATGDQRYSARIWQRMAPRRHVPAWCENVRVVGDRISVSWNDELRPAPGFRVLQTRTISAWGPTAQADLARLHVGVIGAGSVGALVAEGLARTGVERITLLDFDTIEMINLDRLLHASPRDARLARSKVEVLARGLRRSATAKQPAIQPVEMSVVEPEGLASALDCDLLFSCVDRPWPRAVLNMAAYAHLVPVVDGGVLVRTRHQQLLGAEWRAHLAGPGRMCLECLGQYDPALVSVERAGLLDDPTYLATLDDDHPARQNQNVFTFSAAAAASETIQMLHAVVAPGGVGDIGAQLYHFATGTLDRITSGCQPECPYAGEFLAAGDSQPFEVTGTHLTAQSAIMARRRIAGKPATRLARRIDDLLWRLI